MTSKAAIARYASTRENAELFYHFFACGKPDWMTRKVWKDVIAACKWQFNNPSRELKKGEIFSMATVNLINPPKATMNTLTVSRSQAEALGLKAGEVINFRIVRSG